ncbi:MAG: prepilin-type N-terminal cleavage/methylation domain-containing protein [Thermoplasmata archaeon]
MKIKKYGFTLIELLVVVAIIGILTTILLPVLNKAREKAKRAVCVSNLKQLYLVLFMYSNDYSGNFPNATETFTAPPGSYPNTGKLPPIGISCVPPYSSTRSLCLLTGQLDPSTSQIEGPSYVKNPEIFICPSSNDTKSETYYPGYNKCSYAYTLNLNHRTSNDTVILCDKKIRPYNSYHPGDFSRLTDWRNEGKDNHGVEGINVLYVSGNVSWLPAHLWLLSPERRYGYIGGQKATTWPYFIPEFPNLRPGQFGGQGCPRNSLGY